VRTAAERHRTTPIIVLGIVVVGLPCAAAAASLCGKLQYKIAAGGARAKAACHAKASGSGVPIDTTCLARAEEQLARKWAKAAVIGDCPTSADAATVQAAVDAFLAALVAVLEPSNCCNTGSSCFAGPVIDASTCSELLGTLGPPGSVCEGATGACVAPPGTAGSCCAFPQYSSCTAGPTVDSADCVAAGGSDVPNAVCLPSSACVAP
jgi:hypothetical protein